MGFKTATEDLYVWKKVKTKDGKGYMVELLIPKGTKYYQDYYEDKCRAKKAFVLAIYEAEQGDYIEYSTDLVLSELNKIKHSGYYDAKAIEYEVGKMIYPDEFSLKNDACQSGIHFFKTENIHKALSWS